MWPTDEWGYIPQGQRRTKGRCNRRRAARQAWWPDTLPGRAADWDAGQCARAAGAGFITGSSSAAVKGKPPGTKRLDETYEAVV